MPVQHNIELKTNWHDDHLKAICVFANSQSWAFFFRANIENIITSSNNNHIISYVKHRGKLVTDHFGYAEWLIEAEH